MQVYMRVLHCSNAKNQMTRAHNKRTHTTPSGHEAESKQMPPGSFCEKPSKQVQFTTIPDALGD